MLLYEQGEGILSDIILDMDKVEKRFDSLKVVDNLSLKIKEGEFLTLLGPSGCGKTTTLRMIAGFEAPSSGSILLGNEHVENKQPHERNVNTVFQNYALFPHMTVFDNIAYSLKIKKINKKEIAERVNNMLNLVQLNGYDKRMPSQLSGGQRQRVAIARALINSPKVLLLDEPLGALDLKLRKQMQVELKRLQKKLGITFVYVTHDQEEALNMSDRIAVMNKGIIEQVGTPEEIYEKPKTKFVAGFIGESNLIKAYVEEEKNSKFFVRIGDSIMKVENINKDIINKDVYVSVRPESVKYSIDKKPFSLKATIKEHGYSGSLIKTIATLISGQEILIYDYSKKSLLPKIGTEVWLFWESGDMTMVADG